MIVYENVTNNNQTIDHIIIFFALSGDFPVYHAMIYDRPLTINSIVMTVPKNIDAHKIMSWANTLTLGSGLLFLIHRVSYTFILHCQFSKQSLFILIPTSQ
jgi:hypothetical protein